ncbi:hypothetical protein TNCT_597971 [Trichonephila clavata]|uniref:Uncharacterized protein n=1 Tax=Trichonephila clavata TaxID=2740835 RepID=A0A8X6KXS2_TRICU|nr:hypothetical protein TNCT_597971 [Trichonephila clavata]
MANRINLSQADVSKLKEAFDSEEEASEHENHTSNEIWKLSLNPLSHSSQSTAANVIKTTPGVTRYATAKVTDEKSALEVVSIQQLKTKS